MKNYDKNISNKMIKGLAFFLFFIVVNNVYAISSPTLKVDKVRGTVFAIESGKTRLLKTGDDLYDLAEIVTSDDGQISFHDYYDHKYHLSNSANVKVLNKITELKNGYLWVQSKNSGEHFSIQTSNAEVKYTTGEMIVSLDSSTGKSQLMVVNGSMMFSNILEPDLKINVSAGYFSFVEKEYEEAVPRNPTLVGFSSFQKVTRLFDDVKPLDKHVIPAELLNENVIAKEDKSTARDIASIQENVAAPVSKSKGKIILLKRKKFELENNIDIAGLYADKLQKIKRERLTTSPQIYDKHSSVAVKVYGKSGAPTVLSPAKNNIFSIDENKVTTRKIASIGNNDTAKKVVPTVVEKKPKAKDVENLMRDISAVRKPASSTEDGESLFEKSLKREYQQQKRHPDEINDLINELNNYKQDYNKEY